MIAIINKGRLAGKRGSSPDTYKYEIFINDKFIASFTHARSDGLAICLAKASKAVAMEEIEILVEMQRKMKGQP